MKIYFCVSGPVSALVNFCDDAMKRVILVSKIFDHQVTLLAALASTVMAATVLVAALLMLCKGKRTSSAARL